MKPAAQMKTLLGPATVLCFILSSLSLSSLSAAQKRAPSARASAPTPNQLRSLKVSGTTRYTDKEILAASGLELGKDAAEGDFKEAAQHLGDSGLFSSVVYSFSYSDSGIKVEFKLTDNEKIRLVPVHFDNFVWFTEDELLTALKQRVPLFKNSLPTSGRMADRVNEALQALLTERHLPGRVEFLRQSKQDGGELIGIEYRVAEVSIRIRNVEFPGASPDQTAFLTRAAHQLSDADYFRSKLEAVARLDLLPLYLQRGYLKAAFGPSEARVVADSQAKAEDASPNDVEVDAILPVTPGEVYSVSGVAWKGNSAVTTEEASHVFHLAIGRPADAVRLVSDEEDLTRLYKSRGYMTAGIKTEAQLDEEKSAVHYDINITEGDLYKMGELEIVGVDTPSKDRLHDAWKLREGQPYNAEYTRKFLDDAPSLLPRGLRYSVNLSEELGKKEKVVDVTIHFKVQ